MEKIQTFNNYQKLYEDFFRVSFKSVPVHNLVEEYEVLGGTIRIQKNAEHWYHFTPDKISEWELFVLMETKNVNPADNMILKTLQNFAKRKGIKLTKAKEDELLTLYQQGAKGFGLIEILVEDPRVKRIEVQVMNNLCVVHVEIEEYGECDTNLILYPELIEELVNRLEKAGCVDEKQCEIRIANIPVNALVRIKEGMHLTSAFIEIIK